MLRIVCKTGPSFVGPQAATVFVGNRAGVTSALEKFHYKVSLPLASCGHYLAHFCALFWAFLCLLVGPSLHSICTRQVCTANCALQTDCSAHIALQKVNGKTGSICRSQLCALRLAACERKRAASGSCARALCFGRPHLAQQQRRAHARIRTVRSRRLFCTGRQLDPSIGPRTAAHFFAHSASKCALMRADGSGACVSARACVCACVCASLHAREMHNQCVCIKPHLGGSGVGLI